MSTDNFNDYVSSSFERLERRLNGHVNGPLHNLRRRALRQFIDVGIPTRRMEDWKYTSVINVINDAQFSSEKGAPAPAPAALPNEDVYHIVITPEGLDSAPFEADGLTVEVLTDELVIADERVRSTIGAILPIDTTPFVAMNTALHTTGVVIRITGNVTKPIHLDLIAHDASPDPLPSPRILVLASEHASATIVETVRSNPAAVLLPVCEIECQANAHLHWTRVLDDANNRHISAMAANVYGNGSVTVTTCIVDAAFVRNDVVIRLLEPGAQGFLFGVSVLDGQQFADNHTVVDHVMPHCHSEELYKGVYDDGSTGVFNGKIFVRQDAQKTTAYQSNRSLLLSPNAQVNAKPQLEIWADDVKCSHGATTGALDADAIFYLQARGIPKAEARRLLTMAFAMEVLERVPVESLRQSLERRMEQRLSR